MRLLIVFCIIAVLGGAQAGIKESWAELVDSLQGLGSHAVEKLKELAGTLSDATLQKLIDGLQTGKQFKRSSIKESWAELVDSLQGLGSHAIDKLKELAGTLSDATLQKLIDGLQTGKQFKRSSIKESWAELVDSLQGLGSHAIDKLKELAGTLSDATLQKIIDGLQKDKQRRDVDADYELLKQKLKEKLGDKYAELEKILAPHSDKLKELLGKYGSTIKGLIEKIKAHPNVDEIKAVIQKVLGLVGITRREIDFVARNAAKDLVDKYIDQLKQLLKDLLSKDQEARLRRDLGKNIADFFQPHINKINDLVKQIGSTTTDHAKNLWQNLHDSASDLKDKLSGHVDQLKEHGQTLVGHGKDAVSALQESVTDILNSTFQNMVGTLKDAIDTGKDAIDTVGAHVDGAVGN